MKCENMVAPIRCEKTPRESLFLQEKTHTERDEKICLSAASKREKTTVVMRLRKTIILAVATAFRVTWTRYSFRALPKAYCCLKKEKNKVNINSDKKASASQFIEGTRLLAIRTRTKKKRWHQRCQCSLCPLGSLQLMHLLCPFICCKGATRKP